jgi:regulator of RNase E activity RraA
MRRVRVLESICAETAYRSMAGGWASRSLRMRGALFEIRASGAEEYVAAYEHDPQALIAAYRHVEVASVSDATEQLLHQKMYLSSKMRPLFLAKFAGFALTVQPRKEENDDPAALNGMLAAIDEGERDSVYVMSIEAGADITGMGGLMGTAREARDFSGAVVDGSVRDTAYLRKIGFPAYSTGVTPATAVGYYRFAGSQINV